MANDIVRYKIQAIVRPPGWPDKKSFWDNMPIKLSVNREAALREYRQYCDESPTGHIRLVEEAVIAEDHYG